MSSNMSVMVESTMALVTGGGGAVDLGFDLAAVDGGDGVADLPRTPSAKLALGVNHALAADGLLVGADGEGDAQFADQGQGQADDDGGDFVHVLGVGGGLDATGEQGQGAGNGGDGLEAGSLESQVMALSRPAMTTRPKPRAMPRPQATMGRRGGVGRSL